MVDFICDNYKQLRLQDALKKISEKFPRLLLSGEKLKFAFRGRGGDGRDYFFLTSMRVLFLDVKGFTGKKVNYQSIPYSSIKAFQVETAGSLDFDSEMKIWCSGIDIKSISFQKDKVDLFEIHKYMNKKIIRSFNEEEEEDDRDRIVSSSIIRDGSSFDRFLDWLGGDSRQIDKFRVEETLKSDPKVLLEDEKVEFAFQCGRDSTVLTNYRLLLIDKQGLTGKSVSFLSISWRYIRAYEVETAGSFLDRDATMILYTQIKTMHRIKRDLRKGKVDVLCLQRCVCSKVLGNDDGPEMLESEYSAKELLDKGLFYIRISDYFFLILRHSKAQAASLLSWGMMCAKWMRLKSTNNSILSIFCKVMSASKWLSRVCLSSFE
jgi:hypothetical protein